MFMGSRPIPQPKWRSIVAQKGLHRLQPLRGVIQRLLRGGLTGADLLRTFVSRRIQPLNQQEMTLWLYPRLGCPDCSLSTELDETKINTRI
jgi:hypothetical protein